MKVFVRTKDKDNKRKFLCETDEYLNLCDIIKYDGQTYMVAAYSTGSFGSEVDVTKFDTDVTPTEQIKSREELYTGNSELRCPVCNLLIDEPPYVNDRIICPHCNAELDIEVDYTVCYTPTVVSLPVIKDLNAGE